MNKLTISRFASLAYTGQEALNTLCTNLSFSGLDVKKIMITSSHASEGKTFPSAASASCWWMRICAEAV